MTLDYRTWRDPKSLKEARRLKRCHELGIPQKPKRKNRHRVSKETRKFIYKRDGGKCTYCHKVLRPGRATLDHLIPLSKGGDNNRLNLALACRECNQLRGNAWDISKPWTPGAAPATDDGKDIR